MATPLVQPYWVFNKPTAIYPVYVYTATVIDKRMSKTIDLYSAYMKKITVDTYKSEVKWSIELRLASFYSS